MPNAHSLLIRADHISQFHYQDKEGNNIKDLQRFGPLFKNYRYKLKEHHVIMEKIMQKSEFTKAKLLVELRDLVPEARAAYPDYAMAKVADDDVIIGLSVDACLSLLVVFCILGVKPDFDRNLFLGKGKKGMRVREDKERCLRSIFFVGNQIPFVWIDKIMASLKYLRELRDKIGRRKQPLDLLERTLYLFVSNPPPEPKPVDVMHYLRSIILGPRAPNRDKDPMWMVGSKNPHDPVEEQLSAGALYKQGYTFKPLAKIFGCYRGIKCEHGMGMVHVYLPAIVVDDDMSLELAMTSVKKWEDIHCDDGPNTQHHPECTCFFNLLYNLIRTKDDVEVLRSQGVIGGRKLECLPDILSHFYEKPQYDSPRCQKMEIQEYIPKLLPYWKFQSWMLHHISPANLLMMFILAFLQTGYSIASNYKK